VRGRRQRGADEAISFGERKKLLDPFRVGQWIELDFEAARHLDERVAAVFFALRDEALGGGRALRGDVPPLGMEVQARQRAAGKRREQQMLCRPVRLGMRRLAEADRDAVLQALGCYSGQRVITTFFSV
jgi:hypothetical protein